MKKYGGMLPVPCELVIGGRCPTSVGVWPSRVSQPVFLRDQRLLIRTKHGSCRSEARVEHASSNPDEKGLPL